MCKCPDKPGGLTAVTAPAALSPAPPAMGGCSTEMPSEKVWTGFLVFILDSSPPFLFIDGSFHFSASQLRKLQVSLANGLLFPYPFWGTLEQTVSLHVKQQLLCVPLETSVQ